MNVVISFIGFMLGFCFFMGGALCRGKRYAHIGVPAFDELDAIIEGEELGVAVDAVYGLAGWFHQLNGIRSIINIRKINFRAARAVLLARGGGVGFAG